MSSRGILQGLYRWSPGWDGVETRASVIFSGTAQLAARHAQQELAERWGVGVDLWSATSYKRLREEALETERWNRLHPTTESRVPLVTQLLGQGHGPVVTVSDFMRSVSDTVARFVPRRFTALGTDGMGRSDTREALRSFFETDMPSIVVTVLEQLALDGSLDRQTVADAIAHYGVATDVDAPWNR